MPIIYDIETVSGSGLSPNDGIFMLDSSDQSMSSAGSNKLELARSFSQPVRTVEEQFLTLNTIPAISGDLTLEITPATPTVEISGDLYDRSNNLLDRKTTFFKNTLNSTATHTSWNTENDMSIGLNAGPANKAYGVLEMVFFDMADNPFDHPQYWALQYYNDNARIAGQWRAGNTNPAIPAGLTFQPLEMFGTKPSGTPIVIDNTKFAFGDNSELTKTVSITSGIFLTESEIDRVSDSIESLSYLTVSNNEFSFQRALDPIHFEKNKSSLIFSNLSSLQALLIDLLSEDDFNIQGQFLDFSSRESKANSLINEFFSQSSATRRRFDIADLFPVGSLSDVNPGNRFVDNGGVITENINGYINENYNFMVNFLVKSLNQTHTHINLEIARLLERNSFPELFFDNSDFVKGFSSTVSSETKNIIGQNYEALLNTNNDVKTAAINSFDFSSSIQSQSKIILSESSRKNIFSESASQVVGFASNGEPITVYLASSLSPKSDFKHITLDKFSEEAVNQNYSLIGSNQGKGFYLSEDERFEIIYGLTGSSPSVDSISFNESSGEYTVTLAGLDGGFSYQMEFDNILGSIYNTSGRITGIKTDTQTLPISNNFRIDLISGGENQSASFKLLESKDASLNDPSSAGEFSFGDIKFLRPDELIDSQQTIDPVWIVRSSDVRKNFTASLGGSVQNISGENYFVVSINDTAGLVFDIQGTDSLSNPYQVIEASVRGSDETITRNFKLSETPYSFFRLSAFFSEEKDLFYQTGQASESMSPLNLNNGWVNVSNNSGESPVIVSSGAPYTGDISISGFSMLFEFKNLISGDVYNKTLPEFVEFESDTNIYLISGSQIGGDSYNESIITNGVSFTAESSSHIAAVPYSISGSVNLSSQEFLLQQDMDFLLLENTGNIIVGEESQFNGIVDVSGNVILNVDTAISVDSQGNIVNDRGDTIIPSSEVPSTVTSETNLSVDNEGNIVDSQGSIVIDRDSLPGSELTELGIDQTIGLPFEEGELMLFNSLSNIKFFIPAGTTTGVLIP